MKRIFFVFLTASFFTAYQSIAQSPASSVSITRGSVYNGSKFSSVGPVIGYDDMYYYCDGGIKYRPAIFKYDKQLNQVAFNKLGFKTDGRGLGEMAYVSGKIVLLTFASDDKKNLLTYYLETINKNT